MSKKQSNTPKQNSAAARPQKKFPVLPVLIACAVLLVAAAVALGVQYFNHSLTVATINGHAVTQAELQYYYTEEIEDFLEKISRYGDEYETGIDFEKPLSDQACALASDMTWQEYFLNSALRTIQRDTAAAKRAKAENFQLDEIGKAAVQLRVGAMETLAEETGLSLEELLAEKYGKGVTLALIEEIETRAILRERYVGAKTDSFEVTDEAIEERFAAKRTWNMLATYTAVRLDCDSDNYDAVLADISAAEDRDDFLARCEAYIDGDPEGHIKEHTDATASDMEDYTVGEWMFSDDRTAMETTVIKSYDETTYEECLIALQYGSAKRNDTPTYVYQEILIYPDMVHPGDMTRYYGGKNFYLFDLPAMETDNDLFGTYALAHSSQPSSTLLGYDVATAEELADTVFGDWLTEDGRTAGELRAFETEYGAHVLHYIGAGEPYWKANAEAALREEFQNRLIQELETESSVRNGLFYHLLTDF